MSAPADNGATDIVDIEVGGDDSPLSSASPKVVRLPRWDDLGRSYTLNHNLEHKFIPNFSFKGTVTRSRSSSSSSSSRALRSYQPGRAYHTTHGDRLNHLPHELRGGSRDDGAPYNWRPSLPRSRRVRLRELGPPTGRRPPVIHEPAYTRSARRDPAHLEARRSFGRCSKRRGPIHGLAAYIAYRSAPSDLGPPRSPTRCRDPPPPEPRRVHEPPQWMRAGCSCTERLRDPACGSHGPLPAPQGGAQGGACDHRRGSGREIPAIDASDKTVAPCPTSIKKSRLLPLSMLSAPGLPSGMPASSAVRLDGSSRISLGLTAALAQAHKQVADLDDRLKASVAAKREASARSNQQATSLAELSARLQQQLDSSRANDERISQSLRQGQWTEAQIVTLMFPSQPSSSSATPGGNASSSLTSCPALMSPGMGSTSPMYAASGNRGAVDTSAANQGLDTFQARRWSPWSIPQATRSLSLLPPSTLRPCVLRALV